MPTATKTASPAARLPAKPMKPIVDPADWTGEQLTFADDWQFHLTAAEIAELDAAVAGVRERGLDIKDITLADFPLPTLEPKLTQLKKQIFDGRGVGLRIGGPVSQNHNGHLLGHVYDLTGPSRDGPSTRAYHTSAYINYHSDS